MRGRAFQSNFAMGILDEEAHGRVDLQVYVASLGDCANAIPATLGSARRRPGFIDMGAPLYADRASRLIAFRRSASVQLQLEFGDAYMRVWGADGAPVLAGGVPYQLTTPYAAAQLGGIRFDQSNDVLYLTHKSRTIRPHVLQRYANANWAVPALENRNGPWRRENSDPASTITASGLTGNVTLTASQGIFAGAQPGERIRLRTPDGQPSCSSWTVATDYRANELVQSDGKIYRADESRKSGTAAPIHDSGQVYDGNLSWTYLNDGAGVVRLLSIQGPTVATGVVEQMLPGWVINDRKAYCETPSAIPYGPSSRWAFGAWSERYGWPGDVAVTDEERVAFSGPAAEPGRYDLTRSFGFSATHVDFHPGLGSGRVTDDDALSRSIRGGADPIEWLAVGTALMFGTSSREGIVQGDTLDDALTPAGNRPRALTMTGSSPVQPALAHDGALFVPRGGRGLSFLRIGADAGFEDADVAQFVEDLVAERIAGVAWAAHPDRVAWIRTEAGSLLSLTYQPRQNQFGWARHPLPGGFVVESVSVISDGDGRDVPWLIVRREKNGAPQRRIWRLAPRWRTGDPLTDVRYLDGAKVYSGSPTSVLTGLGHLAGETVRVFGDGGRLIFDALVSAEGQVSVPDGETLSDAVTGLRYRLDAVGLPLDVGGPGETLGALQRVLSISLFIADAVEAQVSFDGGQLQDEGGKPWADLPRPSAQVFKAKTGGKTNRDARWRVSTDDCWPLTIRAVRAEVTADD